MQNRFWIYFTLGWVAALDKLQVEANSSLWAEENIPYPKNLITVLNPEILEIEDDASSVQEMENSTVDAVVRATDPAAGSTTWILLYRPHWGALLVIVLKYLIKRIFCCCFMCVCLFFFLFYLAWANHLHGFHFGHASIFFSVSDLGIDLKQKNFVEGTPEVKIRSTSPRFYHSTQNERHGLVLWVVIILSKVKTWSSTLQFSIFFNVIWLFFPRIDWI